MKQVLRYGGLALILAVAALGLGAPAALAQEAGTLEGQVFNGTPDGPAIGAGVPVVLRAFQAGVELEPRSTTTDAGGRFRFEGVDAAPEIEYWPEATYLDITYSSDAAYAFAEGTTTQSATVTVYEVTEDSAALRADGMHLIVNRDEASGMLAVTEIYLISNSGDRTVVGREGLLEGERVSVMIPVPENAQDLFVPQMETGDEVVEMGGVLLDTRPVRPGSDSLTLVFVYALSMPGSEVRLERPVAYPTANVTVLVPEGQLDLRSDQLEFRDVRPFEGVEYRHYATHGVMTGTVLGLAIVEGSGAAVGGGSTSTPGNASRTQGTIQTLGLVLAAMAFAFAVVYPLASRPARRSRRS
jgi:hypothetical protein